MTRGIWSWTQTKVCFQNPLIFGVVFAEGIDNHSTHFEEEEMPVI